MLFVEKKDSKKKMVQDYRSLNEWTIKNNYPLPLISDIVENIGIKKVFMIPKRSFELMVMFFYLTNLHVIFQIMKTRFYRT